MRVSMVVTYYIKLFNTGTDKHNSILMSILLLVAKAMKVFFFIMKYYQPELVVKDVFHVSFIKRLHQHSCH